MKFETENSSNLADSQKLDPKNYLCSLTSTSHHYFAYTFCKAPSQVPGKVREHPPLGPRTGNPLFLFHTMNRRGSRQYDRTLQELKHKT